MKMGEIFADFVKNLAHKKFLENRGFFSGDKSK